MKPMSEWGHVVGMWMPAVIVLVVWLLLIPIRLAALLVLPSEVYFQQHPLHRVYLFFVFAW